MCGVNEQTIDFIEQTEWMKVHQSTTPESHKSFSTDIDVGFWLLEWMKNAMWYRQFAVYYIESHICINKHIHRECSSSISWFSCYSYNDFWVIERQLNYYHLIPTQTSTSNENWGKCQPFPCMLNGIGLVFARWIGFNYLN